ncbi:MAG: Rid family detoxifying hydrolase [Gaiellaceae bacterium]
MPKQEIKTDLAPPPLGPYSQGIRSGDVVLVAGQVGIDPATGAAVPGGVVEQGAQALENVKAILAAAGLTMDDVLKTTVHVTDLATFADFNAVYEGYFAEPRPVRTTVQSGLPGGFLVEVDVMAHAG